MLLEHYYMLLAGMTTLAVVVFIALQYVEAGYGYLFNPKFGIGVKNKFGWILMEAPVFILMTILWYNSDRTTQTVPLILYLLFSAHYIQRSFIFPFLIRGKSKMPIGIVLMGILFNTINAIMQGGWIFYLAPDNLYDDWFSKPYIYIGIILFVAGMFINIQSDHIIRNLRKDGDTRHYIPRKGMFKYVSSANYFGEIVEWCGFAIASWSLSGVVFVIWTFANLTPRAKALHRRYKQEFGEEFNKLKVKRIFPFIY